MISVKDACPEDVNNKSTRHAQDVYMQRVCKKKEEARDWSIERSSMVRTDQNFMKRKPNHSWTTRHAAQGRSWVISGAWTQKRLENMSLGR